MTTVLLLNSGGREHALGHTLVADPSAQLRTVPENPRLVGIGTLHAVDPPDPVAVIASARRAGVDLMIMEPGAPLVAGVADTIREADINYFGPSAAVAKLEGSKAFAKGVMHAAGVPTASACVCATLDKAVAAPDAYGPSYVVKNDDLAAGKEVVVTSDRVATLTHAEACGRVMTEEFLDELELSLFAIYDGVTAAPLPPAQDFKRASDGDAGPNTGNVGVYYPPSQVPGGLVEGVMVRVITPALTGMRRRGTPFTGLLYAGLALTTRGVRVVEFNICFGDPETQVALALLETLLAGVLRAASHGELTGLPPLRQRDGAAVMVVGAVRGYPGTPVGGGSIDLPADTDRVWMVHAGTKATDGRSIASGGRVLGIVGLGEDLDQARGYAYGHLSRVDFPDGFHRTNIGIPH